MKKSLKRDMATVSNDYREVRQFARTMGVPPSTVYLAKEQTSSRRRVVLRSWIEENILKPKPAEHAPDKVHSAPLHSDTADNNY